MFPELIPLTAFMSRGLERDQRYAGLTELFNSAY